VLPVGGTALAMAKALLVSGLLVGLIKLPFATPEALGPGAYGRERGAGGGIIGHRMVRPGTWGRHTTVRGQASIELERM